MEDEGAWKAEETHKQGKIEMRWQRDRLYEWNQDRLVSVFFGHKKEYEENSRSISRYA